MTENKTICILLISMLMLAGCTGQMLKQDTPEKKPQADLYQLRLEANKAYMSGDMKTSEKDYAELVKAVPGEADLWFRLGNVYARTQRPDAAIKAYREALIREPQMSKAWYNMGIMQLRQSVYSFSQLQVYTDPDNPLYNEGKHLLDGIIGLIGKGDEHTGN